jgi:small subunit ribosomal protein S17
MSKAKIFLGKVLSNKMQKTVVVGIERRYKHPQYGKVVTRMTKLYAHADKTLNPGDIVAVVQARPLSRLKRWRVVRVISKGEGGPELSPEEEEKSND